MAEVLPVEGTTVMLPVILLRTMTKWGNADADVPMASSINREGRNPLSFQKHKKAAVYYFNPLHFKERLFGYIVLQYISSDGYDDIYRNWITYVANGLEFLRIKHDIN